MFGFGNEETTVRNRSTADQILNATGQDRIAFTPPSTVLNAPFIPPLAAMYGPLQFNPFQFMEACVAKSAVSAAMGGVMGVGMGFFLGTYSSISPAITLPGVPDPPKIPLKVQFREAFISTGRRCRRWGKNFAMVTAVFSGIECVVEKYRAQHDIKNGVIGGCVTGAVLAANQGPMAMCLGCTGFAAFSAAMESLLGH